ncbi:hypothetical protein BDY19DRAFT_907882 [Irpex rosettiformis]|uniref:Uncharacterized protein n=1 Tax=Irpex rosettiformis TaxID=378272 RepID=A0ACB8TYG2_9APHY|nr:hypothetical protein BDY19DRAFT_907882 [Irpex rosettiformis]
MASVDAGGSLVSRIVALGWQAISAIYYFGGPDACAALFLLDHNDFAPLIDYLSRCAALHQNSSAENGRVVLCLAHRFRRGRDAKNTSSDSSYSRHGLPYTYILNTSTTQNRDRRGRNDTDTVPDDKWSMSQRIRDIPRTQYQRVVRAEEHFSLLGVWSVLIKYLQTGPIAFTETVLEEYVAREFLPRGRLTRDWTWEVGVGRANSTLEHSCTSYQLDVNKFTKSEIRTASVFT